MIRTVEGVCPLCPTGTRRTTVATGRDFEYETCPDNFQFVRCDDCGTFFLDPRPADEEIPKLYPESYQPYRFDELPTVVRWGRDFVQKRKVRYLANLIPAQAHVVDLGCGGGALLRLMRKYGPASWRLSGWDFPGPHLDRVESEGFQIVRGPVETGLVPDSSVDLFVLNQVIEHFPEPAKVVSVLLRALKPGGTLVIETPDVDGLDAQLFRHRYWGGYHFPRHMVLFNGRTLEQLLSRNGFEVAGKSWLTSPAFWIQSFHHAVGESKALRWSQPLFTARNPLALGAATLADLARTPLGPTSNIRVVARRPV